MSIRNLLLASALVLSSACATGRTGAVAKNAANPDKVVTCDTTRVVGSNIPVDVCDSEEAREANREAARQLLRNLTMTASNSHL